MIGKVVLIKLVIFCLVIVADFLFCVAVVGFFELLTTCCFYRNTVFFLAYHDGQKAYVIDAFKGVFFSANKDLGNA